MKNKLRKRIKNLSPKTTVPLVAIIALIFFLGLSSSVYRGSNEPKRGTEEKPTLVVVPPLTETAASSSVASVKPEPVKVPTRPSHYIEIIDGCGPYYDTGVCVNVRSGAGLEFPVMLRLRTGVLLKVADTKTVAQDGSEWYKVVFDSWVRYPERVKGDWYVAASPSVRAFENVGEEWAPEGVVASTTKRIEVSLSKKMLYAYDGEKLFMQAPNSPGLESTPTPRGSFTVYYKTPSRYMQGPIPGVSDQEYDLPGVPWNLYFTPEGAVIHGAYWHNNFGKRWSHGCVNLSPVNAEKLYNWADIGIPVLVRD